MSATHEDWLNAKRIRDNAAFSLSKAYLAGNIAVANTESVKFMEADQLMERIAKELDRRGSK